MLESLYKKYGFYLDALDNFTFKGLAGARKIKSLMNTLRENPPKEVDGVSVTLVEDYLSEEMQKAGFPSSNVLRFVLEDGSWCAVRPSGTEPKCKFYFSVIAENKPLAEIKLAKMKKVFEANC